MDIVLSCIITYGLVSFLCRNGGKPQKQSKNSNGNGRVRPPTERNPHVEDAPLPPAGPPMPVLPAQSGGNGDLTQNLAKILAKLAQ